MSAAPDTLSTDSIRKSLSKNAIESKINYKASDSIRFNISEKKMYLYRDVEIYYDDITLKAAYVELDFNKNTLFADTRYDSLGAEYGRPEFTQGSQSFTALSMRYNFETKKGLISDIITHEGESYLHGNLVKRFEDNATNVKNGLYTTCDRRHPHYEIRFFKARVIPDDKIITGPAYLVIEDVPTPLFVPFGFFPNKKGQLSGILLPTYGESANRGFFFENGGYYWGVNDYLDIAFRGDIYTRGSWAAKIFTNYKKKYKYSGMLNLNYAVNISGDKKLPGYEEKKDFFIRWQHQQDPKARPNSLFSANVNAGTSSYNRYNPSTTGDYLSNDFESSIAYQTGLARGRANFSINLGYKQNTGTHEVLLTAPAISLSVNTFYPLRKKKRVGNLKWYENISVGYMMNAQNVLSTIDSLILSQKSLEKMQNGVSHSIPIRSNVKVLKYFTWTNSLNLNERWYFQKVDKQWLRSTDTAYLNTDTLRGFFPVHDFNVSTSLSTRLYGMYQFKKGPVKALRHVIAPSVGFTYMPDFGTPFWGYYKYTTIDTLGHSRKYSVYENGNYGTPSDGASGKVNIAISNNLEMKVRSKKDTITGTKKVVLIENLTIGTAYDLARDSLNWDNLYVTGRTKLFKRIDLIYNGSWDPYYYDTSGVKMNTFQYDVNRRLFRSATAKYSIGLNWSLSSNDFKSKKTSKGSGQTTYHPDGNVDYTNPWSINLAYNLTFTNNFSPSLYRYVKDTIQTLQITGDVNITRKWKFGMTTGFDFNAKDISYTSLNIYRDLHCWEMVIQWIPFGARKSYNLTIRVKASVLQDLKLTKKTDFRDNAF